MSKITVEVPDSVLDKEKQKELKSLRGQVKRLQDKVAKLEYELRQAQYVVEQAQNLKMLVNESGLVDRYDW